MIATTRYCSGVEGIPEHIPVVIFVSCRLDSLMFARSSVFPREEPRCIMGYFFKILGATRVSGVPAVYSDNLCRLA